MEQVSNHIDQLKHLVSLRYIDPLMRSKCFQVFSSQQAEQSEMVVCHDYVVKIEEQHQKMMTQVSMFLSMLTPVINDCSHQNEITQQQIIEKNKMHQLQIREMHNQQCYLNEKIESLTQELHEKDEYIRELNAKIDEKDAFLEQREKEQHQYMSKVQVDFLKLQKNLEEFLFIINKKDEEIQGLKQQIHLLQESKSRIVEKQRSDEYKICEKKTESKKQEQKSDDSYQIVQCSLVSSSHKNSSGLSQFEEIRMGEEDSREGNQEPFQRSESIRQMLNLSYEKEFKHHYHKFESSHQNSKQNYYKGWNRYEKSKSDEKKPIWAINQSLELVDLNQKKDPVKQFKLGGAPIIKENNIYYLYFMIACQNVKIRSPFFEQFSFIETEPEWEHLNKERIPLHEWQASIENYLLQKSKEKYKESKFVDMK